MAENRVMAKHSIDHTIIKEAAANNGAISRSQLTELCISARSVSRRIESGLLVSVLAGFYVVPLVAGPVSAANAVLLAHPGGAIARSTAARMHGFPTSGSALKVVVAHGANLRAFGVDVHETRHLPEHDVVELDGMRVTSAARTICDLASSMSHRRLAHIIETQLTRSCPSQDDLIGCVEIRRRRRAPGMTRLSQIITQLVDDEPYPESKLEIELFTGLRRLGIVGLKRQFRPPWYDGIRGIVDGADPIGRTIVEADGRRFRQVTEAHDNDRRRDRLGAAHGWATVRVGWRELTQNPDGTLGEIANVIEARRQAIVDKAA